MTTTILMTGSKYEEYEQAQNNPGETRPVWQIIRDVMNLGTDDFVYYSSGTSSNPEQGFVIELTGCNVT